MTRRTRTHFFRLASALFAALTLAALLFASPALDAYAQQQPAPPEERGRFEHGLDDWSGPWLLPEAPASEVEALNTRWRAIEEELKTTGSEFAGS